MEIKNTVIIPIEKRFLSAEETDDEL